MKLSEYQTYGSFYTGYPSIDFYLEGFPRGHFLQFAGRESCYKTTFLQNCMGYTQHNLGDSVAYLYVDTEGNVEKEYFETCGGISELTEFLQENASEDILIRVHDFIIENNKNEKPSLVVIDSIAGFTTDHEIKQGIGKATMGDLPRILNRFLRLTAIPLKAYGSTVIFSNQLRDNLQSQFGGTTTPGGRGIKHWAKYMVNMYDLSSESRMFELATTGERGHAVNFQVDKGKNEVVYKGFSFSMDVILGKGFSRELDVFNFGVANGMITARGHWYTLPDGGKYGSKALVYEALVSEPDLTESLYRAIMGLDEEALDK